MTSEQHKEQLSIDLKKAEFIANQLYKLIIGQEFTITEMAKLMKVKDDVAKSHVNFIAQFGYIKVRLDKDIPKYKITLDIDERTQIIMSAVEHIRKQADHAIINVIELAQMIKPKLEIVN